MDKDDKKEMEMFIDTFLNKVFEDSNAHKLLKPLEKLIDELNIKSEDKESKGELIASFYRKDGGVGIKLESDDNDVLPNMLAVLLRAVHQECKPEILNFVLTEFQEYVKQS
jgi:hypothetical protein